MLLCHLLSVRRRGKIAAGPRFRIVGQRDDGILDTDRTHLEIVLGIGEKDQEQGPQRRSGQLEKEREEKERKAQRQINRLDVE